MYPLAAIQASLEVWGVRLAGLNGETARKLLLTVVLAVVLLGLSYALRALLRAVLGDTAERRAEFWASQGVQLTTAVLIVVGAAAIWFDDPGRLATVLGLVTAGVAVALQRVVTAFAAYLIILRGRVFTIGDRITIGGVRGDVVQLGFMQTTVMEMGEPPSVQAADPAVWVAARQYTGRIVRVTNDKIFDSPVYNYTREFPYLWEELHLPVKYEADRARAEQILLEVARRHTTPIVEQARDDLRHLRRRFYLPEHVDLTPGVYFRLTDNWLELTVRFLAREHGVRVLKDAMSRDILAALEDAGIEIASATYDIVGMPALRVEVQGRDGA
ncbi:MAG TPA: mechanosensitive ion channel domain-containing protein [Gemmatimonadaceae bacterium]|nr:mechanosensitive ion channel domain-containing protein [Gemmatimonadaceae bacterium]